MQINNWLKRLCDADAPSGSEQPAAKIIQEILSEMGIASKCDRMGNVIARLGGNKQAPLTLLDAHMDQIGLIVTGIDAHGFLKVAEVGGIDRKILIGSRVRVLGKKTLPGVFCALAPHLQEQGDRDQLPKLDQLCIDIGLDCEQAKQLVSPGDYVCLEATFTPLVGTQVTCRSLDNRAGCACVLAVLEQLLPHQEQINVAALFSVQEEVGLLGAVTGSFTIKPERALIYDVSFGWTPDAPKEKCGEVGKGPMLGISPVLSRSMFERCKALAEQNNISYQVEVMGGKTGTNSDAVAISGLGVPAALFSIPLKYMHTAVEVIDTNDIVAAAKLSAAMLLDKEIETWIG